ncbi:hypothetical protein tloyanaT_32210 [Thalassotalea loyana]|uniref:Uncharacterized protein n=1 Tax=Thalassotalea loyana TaxID=280483 RepID=A0ABQ6HFW5_9GAMM|nr:hypothetical protein [Thalassotalea loyana]GLX86968.1 hypothetical protein tloyanaT_32210 [Thalassotalea loyana]
MQYFYRFLRTKDDGSHLSELKNQIRFYIEEDCNIKRDFTENSPIVKMKGVGEKAQVTFGMTDKNDVMYAYEFFGQPDRILARISLDYLINELGVSLNVDQQMNTGFSKYLLGKYHGERIVIPDAKVEVLSLGGWKPKGSDTFDMYIRDFYCISPAKYSPLLANI